MKLLDMLRKKDKMVFNVTGDPATKYRMKGQVLEKYDGSKWIVSTDALDFNADIFEPSMQNAVKRIYTEWVIYNDPADPNGGWETLKSELREEPV